MSRIIGYRAFYTLNDSPDLVKEMVYNTGDLMSCRGKSLYYFTALINQIKNFGAPQDRTTVFCAAIYDSKEYNELVPPIAIHKPGLTPAQAVNVSLLMPKSLDIASFLSYGLSMEALHLPDYKEADTSELFAEITDFVRSY